MTREGEVVTLTPEDLNFQYRQSDLPEGWVITASGRLRGPKAIPRSCWHGWRRS